jgi:hypothetical protein
MGINYKGSQGQTERAVVLQDEEEDWKSIVKQTTNKKI